MNKCYISNNDNDIRIINDYLNKKGIYPENAYVTSELYHQFCSEVYCAGWLTINDDFLKQFAKWIYEQFENDDERFEDYDIQLEHLCD